MRIANVNSGLYFALIILGLALERVLEVLGGLTQTAAKLAIRLKPMLAIAFLLCLMGGQSAQAGPQIIISADKGFYKIGEPTVYKITGARPSFPVFWSSWKNGVSTGEVNQWYGDVTDIIGHLTVQTSGTYTAADVGFWKKQVTIGGLSAFITFYVVPTLTTNASVYPINTYTYYSLSGAPPSSPIYWSTWRDGVSTEVDSFYGHYTDSSGNWSGILAASWQGIHVGHWRKQAKVGSTTNFGTSVEFLVVNRLTLNKPSYLVGELINFSLTGAPPNSPIYWTSWQDGVLRNNNAFYGHYTDQFGNWSTLSDLPKPEYVGAWQGYITVGFSTYSFGFSVKPKPLSSENYFARTVSTYRWEQLGYANGAKLIGDLGSRTLHLLFDAPGCNPSTPGCNVNANPFIELAQTADISKEFGDPRFNAYVLTMFGGRATRDVAYLTSGGQPLTKYFWSPDLFNPAISPIPNYRDRIISEISEFAQYLIQTYRGTGKKFILSNWETDNVVRCGEAVSYAEVNQAATRRPPMKICNGISTPTAGEIIPYTSDCSDGSPGVLAKGCAVGQGPNAVALYVRQNESCPGGTSYSVTPLSLGANGGWIPQDPNDPDHNPQWSYPFRTWCDGSVGPVSFNLKKYDGSPGLPDDSVDGFRRIFEAKQEGVRQGRESAAAQGWGGVEVYHAPEFNTVRLLKDQGFKNVLYDALTNVDFDFVSYSAYETTNASVMNLGPAPSINTGKITDDLNLISSILAPTYVGAGRYRNIIIGEFAFNSFQASTSAGATSIYGTVLDTATNWGAPYAFNWQIYENLPNWYGLYDGALTRTPLGNYYRQRYGY